MPEMRKCIVWDLDNTLWDGICLEGNVNIRHDVIHTIKELDSRGILHSIASRGDENLAMRTLRKYDIDAFFLCPKINWMPKPNNIIKISEELGIPLNAIAFIDDDCFELEQAGFMLPEVMTIKAADALMLQCMPEFTPEGKTSESSSRRMFYIAEQKRKEAERNFPSREEFLKSCQMKLRIRKMDEEDIPRVMELMTRTHQLNTTGWILSPDKLKDILINGSERLNVTVAELTDRFGGYGIIAVSAVEKLEELRKLNFLAVSCRVMGRGIERALITYLLNEMKLSGIRYADALFRETGRNRMMLAFYQMMGFNRVSNTEATDEYAVFRFSLENNLPLKPAWIEII